MSISARSEGRPQNDLITVLLVEDDDAVRDMYRWRLELDGYQVHTAADGEEGLDKASRLRPHIIFLDIRLPKMDGFEVLKRLRAQRSTRDVPVIILSNFSETDLVERGHQLGAHEYLIKARTTPAALSAGIEERFGAKPPGEGGRARSGRRV
jgi:DNA-binding response OmpR family regulator